MLILIKNYKYEERRGKMIEEFETDSQSGKYLTFTLEKEIFGIEIRNVSEIIGIQPITKVPEVQDYVKGIINLRGKIIPVIEARLKFKKESIAYDDRTCIIVIDVNEVSFGLIVDTVDEVSTLSKDQISLPPGIGAGFESEYINGIGKLENNVLLLIDCEKLLIAEELSEIKNIA